MTNDAFLEKNIIQVLKSHFCLYKESENARNSLRVGYASLAGNVTYQTCQKLQILLESLIERLLHLYLQLLLALLSHFCHSNVVDFQMLTKYALVHQNTLDFAPFAN